MKAILKGIFAVIVGLLAGGSLNMGLIMISPYIIPPPAGADVTTMEGLLKALPLFTPINFLMPFLAHALGTLLGAVVAYSLAKERKFISTLLIGVFFLWGGIENIRMLPSPLWFSIVDLVFAYFPMSLLGFWIMNRNKEEI